VAFYPQARFVILKENRVLTQEAFDRMLARLGPDRERAGVKYELLRANLIGFFKRQGVDTAAELADETINRVARKMVEGEIIPDPALPGYIHAVARNIWREHLRRPDKATSDLETLPHSLHPAIDPAEDETQIDDRLAAERRLECLDTCMGRLNLEDRELLASYYLIEDSQIENRRILAERLGMTLPHLRMRMYRLKERIRKCIHVCVDEPLRL
jgi:RNA polymerase sigma factor (sigma-70 family)